MCDTCPKSHVRACIHTQIPVVTSGPHKTTVELGGQAEASLRFWRWEVSRTGGFEPQPLELGFSKLSSLS